MCQFSLKSESDSLSPCHLLVCEDSDDSLLVLRRTAESLGCKLTVARDGQEAIDLSHVEKYDVILMDLQMPVKNGLEASRYIRTTENPNRTTPIIAVTAEVSEMVATASASFGIDDYLCKPVKSNVLYRSIKRTKSKFK